MFLSKNHIPRRAVLKGAGATLALPLLDAMFPAATQAATTAAGKTPKRFAFIGFPQGVSGRATLHMPPDWEAEPNHWSLQVAANEKFRNDCADQTAAFQRSARPSRQWSRLQRSASSPMRPERHQIVRPLRRRRHRARAMSRNTIVVFPIPNP